MILVTGATGFLGNHLLMELIKSGIPIRALYHHTLPNFIHENIEWVQCNLFDTFEVEEVFLNVKTVYHCAAIVSFDPRKKEKMIHENVLITANIVNAALNQNVDDFLHVSSVAALGRSNKMVHKGESSFIDENSQWEDSSQNSAYAKSKYLSELEVWRAIAEGLNAVIINPALILGEGDWNKGSSNLMQIVDNEFPWYTEGINAWVDVKDVVRAMLLLMNSNYRSERFIISCGNFAFKEIFTKMALSLNKRPPFRKANRWMTEIVWRIEVLKSILTNKDAVISKETAQTAHKKHYYKNDKFIKNFPDFTYTSIDDTIERMSDIYKKSIS